MRDRRAQDEQAACLVTNRERQNQHGVALMKVKLVLHVLGQSRERDLLSRPGGLAEPAVGVLRHMPFALVAGRGGDNCALSVQQDETDCRRPPDESQDRRDRSFVDLLTTACRDELDARPSQCQLARCRSLLLTHQTDHAGHDEKEQQRRRHDQHEDVRVVERLVEPDAGRDQTGSREQPEPEWGEARARLVRRLLERAHRGVERGGAPEQVVDDPAHVVAQLVVVRVGEQRVGVGGVDGEQRDDAADEEVEGRSALSLVDRQADHCGEEQDVSERIGGGYPLLHQCQPGEVDVRSDQEDPGEQRDADREDEGVDHAGAVALRVSPSHEHEQPDDESRVDGQIDGVAERRELHLDAEELRVAVGVEVAGEEEELPDDDEQPGGARLRPVQVDPDRDRNRRGEAEEVDQRAARLQRRQPEVAGGEEASDGEVENPDAPTPVDAGEQPHAAYSCRPEGRSSYVDASLPSTSMSCSISAWELAAVTWILNPTSLFGTSG